MKKYAVIDVEKATNYHNSICSIGIVTIENNVIKEKKEWLVKPPNNKFNYLHTSIHGISSKDTENAPTFLEIWDEIEEYFTDYELVSHNRAIEKNSIEKTLAHYYMPPVNLNFFCTLETSRRILNYLPNYKLSTLCCLFGINFDETKAHNALYDAEKTAEYFIKLITFFEFDESGYPVTPRKKEKIKPQKEKQVIDYVKLSSNKIHPDQKKFIEPENNSHYLYKKNILITGTLKKYNLRNDLAIEIQKKGGINKENTITKSLHILVVGTGAGLSKLAQAKELNVEIITEEEFLKILNNE